VSTIFSIKTFIWREVKAYDLHIGNDKRRDQPKWLFIPFKTCPQIIDANNVHHVQRIVSCNQKVAPPGNSNLF